MQDERRSLAKEDEIREEEKSQKTKTKLRVASTVVTQKLMNTLKPTKLQFLTGTPQPATSPYQV